MSLLEINFPPGRDPDGRRLREVLEIAARIERLAALRSLLVHALAVVGVLVWLDDILPAHIPETLHRILILLLPVLAVLALATAIQEAHWLHVQRGHIDGKNVKVVGENRR